MATDLLPGWAPDSVGPPNLWHRGGNKMSSWSVWLRTNGGETYYQLDPPYGKPGWTPESGRWDGCDRLKFSTLEAAMVWVEIEVSNAQ